MKDYICTFDNLLQLKQSHTFEIQDIIKTSYQTLNQLKHKTTIKALTININLRMYKIVKRPFIQHIASSSKNII